MKSDEFEYSLIAYCRKGGKISRNRQADRVRQLVTFCKTNYGVRGVDQIGNKHLFHWYEESELSDSTLTDRYYAACLLWELLGRGEPPHFDQLRSRKNWALNKMPREN
jgi:hypothetical protein